MKAKCGLVIELVTFWVLAQHPNQCAISFQVCCVIPLQIESPRTLSAQDVCGCWWQISNELCAVLPRKCLIQSKTLVREDPASPGMRAALQPPDLSSHHVYEFSRPSSCPGTARKASSALAASLSSEFTVGWLSWQLEQTLSIWTKTVAMETKFYFLLIISPANVWAFARLGLISQKGFFFFCRDFSGHYFQTETVSRTSYIFYTHLCSLACKTIAL